MLPYKTANLRGSMDGLLQKLGFFPVSSNMHLLAHPASRRGSEKVCSFWTIDVSAVEEEKVVSTTLLRGTISKSLKIIWIIRDMIYF